MLATVTGFAGGHNVGVGMAPSFAERLDMVHGEALHPAAAIDATMPIMVFDGLPLRGGQVVKRGSRFSCPPAPIIFQGGLWVCGFRGAFNGAALFGVCGAKGPKPLNRRMRVPGIARAFICQMLLGMRGAIGGVIGFLFLAVRCGILALLR